MGVFLGNFSRLSANPHQGLGGGSQVCHAVNELQEPNTGVRTPLEGSTGADGHTLMPRHLLVFPLQGIGLSLFMLQYFCQGMLNRPALLTHFVVRSVRAQADEGEPTVSPSMWASPFGSNVPVISSSSVARVKGRPATPVPSNQR